MMELKSSFDIGNLLESYKNSTLLLVGKENSGKSAFVKTILTKGVENRSACIVLSQDKTFDYKKSEHIPLSNDFGRVEMELIKILKRNKGNKIISLLLKNHQEYSSKDLLTFAARLILKARSFNITLLISLDRPERKIFDALNYGADETIEFLNEGDNHFLRLRNTNEERLREWIPFQVQDDQVLL